MILTKEELEQYMKLLDKLPASSKEVKKIHDLLKAHKKSMCQTNFMSFVRQMWSAFIPGRHHQIMANAFERVVNGDLKRLIINMPPRHTKSEFASFLLPSFYLGKRSEEHTSELQSH